MAGVPGLADFEGGDTAGSAAGGNDDWAVKDAATVLKVDFGCTMLVGDIITL